MRKLIVGNWKMNGLFAQLDDIAAITEAVAAYPAVDTALCVPALLIRPAAGRFADMAGRIAICRFQAHTPDASPPKCWPMPVPD